MTLEDLSGWKKAVGLLAGFIFEGIGNSTTFKNMLLITNSSQGKGSDSMLVGVINSYYPFFAGIGFCLCLIFFLMEVNKVMLMQGNDFTMKSLMSCFLKYGVCMMCIFGGTLIITGLLNINNAVINKMFSGSGFGGQDDGVLSSLYEAIDNMKFGIFEGIAFILIMLVIALVSMIVMVIYWYQAISRKLEIILRCTFLGVSLGDIFNGKDSNGIKNCRKILALGLYGGGLCLLLKIQFLMQEDMVVKSLNLNGTFVEMIASILMLVVVPLAGAGMTGTLKTVCNDICGC